MSFFNRWFGSKGRLVADLLEEGAFVVDVRSPAEYKTGHGKESRNIPLQAIPAKVDSLRKQNRVIITCCASGMRSGKAAKILNKSGVEAYNGGAWQKVERASQRG
jgi:rhodanese-related sulfurtransferase